MPSPSELPEAPGDEVVERWILARLRGEEPDLEPLLAELEAEEARDARRRIEAFEATRDLAAPESGSVPRAFGDFAVEAEIGRGGMGVVYRARQLSLDRTVALKVLPSLAALDGRRVERFLREETALSKLDHEGIVPVLVAGETEGTLWFAMPLVRGASLDRVLDELSDVPVRERTGTDLAAALARAAGLPRVESDELDGRPWVATVVRIAAHVADALVYAHANGVLHRDVKPSNVLLGADGRPRLIDFGLAKVAREATLTASREVFGTPSYLAPECVEEGGGSSERSDVYSLGVLLYELLCGRRPFEAAEAGSLGALFARIQRGDFARPRSLVSGLSRDLETLCLRAMETDPARRYASMADLAHDLHAFLEYRPIRARPPGPLRRARMLLRRRPALTWSAGAVLALAVGGAVTPAVRAAARAGEAREVARDLREALADDRLDRAGELLAHLGALDETHPEREPLRRAIDLARCDRALSAAAELSAELERLLARRAELDPRILAADKRQGARVVTEDERRELARLRAARERLRAELERRRVDTEAKLRLAETWAIRAGAERHPPVQRAFAAFHAARFREARVARDEVAAEVLAELVRERDDEGRFAAELAGLGSLRVEGPAGATAFLYRYRPLARVREDRWMDRLVPVPFRGAEPDGPLRPGDACLEVIDVAPGGAAEAAGLRPGDLVVAVDGSALVEPPRVGEVLTGTAADAAGVGPWDRIVSIGGVATERFPELFEAESRGGPFPLVVDSAGERVDVPAAPGAVGIDESPGVMPVGLPALFASLPAPRPIELAVVRAGGTATLELPPGAPPLALARLTRTPLLPGPEAALGPLPADVPALEPGSYLLLVRRAGCADLRLPFELEPLADVRLEADPPCPPESHGPPPLCVWVPAGDLRRGTDPLGTFAADPGAVHVPGFWMGVWELTMGEWWEFLSDPEVLARVNSGLAATGRLALVPRDDSETTGLFGELALRWMHEPVRGVSYRDVEAFLAHLNARLEADGSPWRADLPTDAEWERAAAGADDRPYPWGRTFDPSLCESVFSKRSGFWEPVYAQPADESPFGIQGMAGSVAEWTRTQRDDTQQESRYIHGGSRWASAPETFRIQARLADGPQRVRGETGLRLVYRRVEGE